MALLKALCWALIFIIRKASTKKTYLTITRRKRGDHLV